MKPQITITRLTGMIQFWCAFTPQGLGSALTIEDRREAAGFVEVTLRIGRRIVIAKYWGRS